MTAGDASPKQQEASEERERERERERKNTNKEANSTCTTATTSRGQGKHAARLTTSILPAEGLTNRAGRTRRGTTRPPGDENLQLPASRPLFDPSKLHEQSGQHAAKATIPKVSTYESAT